MVPEGHARGTAELTGVELAPELTRFLPYLMRRAFAYLGSKSDRSTQARDFAVLAALADGPEPSQQALAERLEINRTIMVKLIDRLAAEGHVTRTRNPENRRSYLLGLTEAGRRELDRMRSPLVERDRLLTANLAPAERDRLNELLSLLLAEPPKASDTVSTEYLVGQVFYLLRRRGDAAVSEHGLRVRDYSSTYAVGKLGPCPQQQLARYLALSEPATAMIMDELVEKGLVTRGQDPDDRRRYALELTALGRERLAFLAEAADRIQAEVVQTLGGHAHEAELHGLLTKMLGTPAPAPSAAPGR
ncbi:MAG TPA: MarR family transcriptional regulator [Actinocrinis sp.]|nr:MarR family transcriptional regulator [Actinocrinis sp.]